MLISNVHKSAIIVINSTEIRFSRNGFEVVYSRVGFYSDKTWPACLLNISFKKKTHCALSTSRKVYICTLCGYFCYLRFLGDDAEKGFLTFLITFFVYS